MLLFLLLTLSAHAENPASTTTTTDPQFDDYKHVVVDKDWMSKVAIDHYGENEGAMLTPYLCTYNKQHGRTTDCDIILPGQEILLPPIWVLRCAVTESLGFVCSVSADIETKRMIAALPPEVQACVATLQSKAPNAYGGLLVMVAKAVSIQLRDSKGLTYSSPDYQTDCGNVSADAIKQFEIPMDYLTTDENGKPLIVHILGPEDY